MGFPGATIRIPKLIRCLFDMLHHIKFMAPSCLGLLHPPEQEDSLLHPVRYDLTVNHPVSTPMSMCKASIKKRLPVVSYQTFLGRHMIQEAEDIDCAVCLNELQKCNKIRELSSCSHVFHRECLDNWVDEDVDLCFYQKRKRTKPVDILGLLTCLARVYDGIKSISTSSLQA
ncbi:brassinosteroid-responsive RING protein 1-like [Actinidia eriantha]|uniref:brassinosteroid-responsive RING protein 1-like n=1 Tax=Actinidia eriantha TaxID=165200 RepID=UPI002587F534|nr:brassinosteroid-responsive RING protein 1-like [Actinidia eriantha]